MLISHFNFQPTSHSGNKGSHSFVSFHAQDQVSFGSASLRQKALRALESEDVETFNKIKQQLDNQKEPLNLEGYNFSGKRLPKIDLSGLNLIGAIIKGTDLTDAELEGAQLLRMVADDTTIWTGTVFDRTLPINGPSLEELQRGYHFEIEGDSIVGYRTNASTKGGFTYEVGKKYKSDLFSRDKGSRQHGLWFYPSVDIVRQLHPDEPIIKVLVPYGDPKKSDLIKGDLDFRAPEFKKIVAFVN